MKSIYFILVIIFLSKSFSQAQSPNWLWAKSSGDSANERGNGIATDASGNIYVTGYFYSDSIRFGNTVLYNSVPDSIAPDSIFIMSNMFIVKYDSSGNVLWSKGAGGTLDDIGESITTDNYGNVYVTGYFESDSIIFGSILLTHGGEDVFIVKYDSSGNVLWAKCAGGNQASDGHGVTTDATGNVYMTGEFKVSNQISTIIFGSFVLTPFNIYDRADIFIVKYDSSGNVIWAKREGGTTDDVGVSITTDIIGNVYVTGYFGSPSITFGSSVVTNAGMNDIFIVKYDSSGNVNWAKSAGGINLDYITSIITDFVGNVYVTGQYNSPTIALGSTVLTNNSGNCGISGNTCFDVFLFKYDSTGNVLWAKSAGEIANDIATSITTDGIGNVYITGNFQLDSITFGNTVLTNAGMFVVKYDSSGNVPWAISTGASSASVGNSITSDAWGNLYVTGYLFDGSSALFGSTVLTNAGGEDIFTAKLSSLVTGINDPTFSDENVIVISPNPTTDRFMIKNISSNEQSMMQILNPLGEIIYSKKLFGNNEYLIDANLSKGTYFVKVSDEEKNIVRKLVIE